MKDEIGYWIKHFLGAAHLKQQPFKKPIIIVSTRRSGSTLLLEMIHTQPGLTYSDQPLDQWHYKPKYRELPPQKYSQFIHLDAIEKQQTIAYLQQILHGEIRMYAPWRWLDKKYSWKVNRVVTKILNGHVMIEDFAKQLDAHIIYLIRHPLPNALSIANLKWGNVGEAFLDNEWYCSHLLSSSQMESGKKILKEGSILEKLVLEWSLANLIPLQHLEKENYLVVTYEELVLRPYSIAKLIANYCELPSPEIMLAQSNEASRTTSNHNQEIVLQKDKIALLARWQNKIPVLEARKMMDIVHRFSSEVPYHFDSIFPESTHCHFGVLHES